MHSWIYFTDAILQTIDKVKSFVQPFSTSLIVVNTFAKVNDLELTSASLNGNWVLFTTIVSYMNMLFRANYETFAHTSMVQPIVCILSVLLPSDLMGHIDILCHS